MIRRIIFAAAIAAAATGVAIAPASPALAYSQCAANTYCGWLFYSDPQLTRQVGGHTTNCEGSVLDWGIKQGYSVFVSGKCGIIEV